MMATDTYTISQLLADESLRRKLAGKVLNAEEGWCKKCTKEKTCTYWNEYSLKCRDYIPRLGPAGEQPVPDPATGSEADIAEQLTKKCFDLKPPEHLVQIGDMYGELMLDSAVIDYWYRSDRERCSFPVRMEDLHRWWRMTLAERIACCLMVLLPGEIQK